MPVHDWTRVDAGIFHAFHHSWIEEIARALNGGILPPEYYALPEQHAAGFGPDVLTLQEKPDDNSDKPPVPGTGRLALAAPKLPPTAETDIAFYRSKQSSIAVRHASGDDIVAMVEIVSPGNKASRKPLRAFVDKAVSLLEQQIHLQILDLLPPGRRDPNGIHGKIWEEIAGQDYVGPADKPLTLVAYESDVRIRAYVVRVAVSEPLSDMPLFLAAQKAVDIPLEATYQAAVAAVPRRWRRVLEAPASD
jgi:hypothetical protein